VDRLDRALVLDPQAGLVEARRLDRGDELGGIAFAPGQGRIGAHLAFAGHHQLESVVACVGDRVETDQLPHVGGAPPRYRADQRVAFGQPDQQLARAVRQRRVLGVLDDRRQRAVEVGEDRRPPGLGTERLEQHLPGRSGGLGFARHGT
jgi:hypothetical protein